jgi:hypothetical protein
VVRSKAASDEVAVGGSLTAGVEEERLLWGEKGRVSEVEEELGVGGLISEELEEVSEGLIKGVEEVAAKEGVSGAAVGSREVS